MSTSPKLIKIIEPNISIISRIQSQYLDISPERYKTFKIIFVNSLPFLLLFLIFYLLLVYPQTSYFTEFENSEQSPYPYNA